MKLFLTCLIFFTWFQATAQADSLPIYKRFPSIPPFSLIKVPDSSRFTKDDLEGSKHVLIFIFSPDCDHCIKTVEAMLANTRFLKKTRIVMVSALNYAQVNAFYIKYQLSAHPGISVATDPAFFLGTFYSIREFPSVFLYKKGKLVAEQRNQVSFPELLELL